jgi:hypothetical protein
MKRAKIDPPLKQLILSLTSEIEQVIQQYRIGGPEGLKRTLPLIRRQANLNIETVEKGRTHERARGLWRRAAVKFFAVVRFANNTWKIVDVVSPLVRNLAQQIRFRRWS